MVQEASGCVDEEGPQEVPRETWEDLLARITGIDPRVCPHYGKGKMIQREILSGSSVNLLDRMPLYGGCPP